MEDLLVTGETFKKRMVDLCLRSGLTEFPTKRQDQLILLKSIAVFFEENKKYSEAEVNDGIKRWLDGMSCFPGWDHLTLRRRLIDDRFFTRSRDGSSYRIHPDGSTEIVFDPLINRLDVFEVLKEGQEFIARKKAEYLYKQANSL